MARKTPASKQAKPGKGMTYAEAGVHFETHEKLVKEIVRRTRKTLGPEVIQLPGGFAGLFGLGKGRRAYKKPILAACTDGVGTKLKLAFALNRHDTVGIDCVAMSVNDMLCVGAEPLFFLDYIATGRKNLSVLLPLISGVTEGCRQANCALLGGETAEMPGFYPEGEYDIAGFAVGVVEKGRELTGENVKPGDVLIGLSSSGLHSNGFSLVRKIVDRAGWKLTERIPELGCELGEELLRPTRIYVKPFLKLLHAFPRKRLIQAAANITGGGFFENIPRAMPKGCRAVVEKGSWKPQPIFPLLQQAGEVDEVEMHRVFNMGIGMVLFVRPRDADDVLVSLKKQRVSASVIGEVKAGKRGVALV